MYNLRPETKARIGLLLEGHVQHDFMNVVQIEKFYRQFFPNWNRDIYFELLKRLQVTTKQPLNTMSCGQRSQVALGLLLAQNPDILILDDFSMGLDPGYRRLFVEYLKAYASAEDKTIFLTSHIIQDMEMLIDDCMILDYGRILTHRPTSEILENFTRYTFASSQDLEIEDERLWNLERVADGNWECYSFCSDAEVTQILTPELSNGMKSEKLSLEDAFIGLTGKY